MMAMNRGSKSAAASLPSQGRSLLKDQFYVIKVIDVAEVPQKVGLEALQEIEMMGLLDSQYIVGYFDSFIDDQKINIVIEYCPGGDLNSLVQKQKSTGKPFVDKMIWKLFIHVCLGLQYLHSKHIIHRDLKSLNVFMMSHSAAKIGDLGCAKQLPPEGASEHQEESIKKGDLSSSQVNQIKEEDPDTLLKEDELKKEDLSSE